MTTKTALMALFAIWGVGTSAGLPALAQDAADDDRQNVPGLTDRVWSKADDGGLPSDIRIFLSDGTLVQDSCWETHRLSQWRLVSPTEVSWNEDGMDINADIVTLSESELVLNLKLVNETVEQHFVPAEVPYLCPDMPDS